ncbi:MAG TPA: adenylate/guanylate cyclase domain-containing protein [Candidatus Acidoferrales bacterium]|nr:adenylate/guanylate cyclase domain-containing protein [Candidatus Acidoferrales bacterium]
MLPSAASETGAGATLAGSATERKQVTILFADISGFTAFSAQMDPEELRDCMRAIWERIDAVVSAHGGIPEKHSGDAVMAVFGGRKAREEDPAEAVRAALEIQAYLKSRASGRAAGLQMRIGIHTGLVVVGPMNLAGEFLATGEAVNLASRLEKNAPVGGILISSETFRLVYGNFDTQALPPLLVKGLADPLETYLILRAKSRGMALQMRGIAGLNTELIGRRHELDRLQSAFEEARRQGRLRLVTILGEAGIGKSRLVQEFARCLESMPTYVRFFSARAAPETSGAPFALVRDLFALRFEILESDSAALASQKFQGGLAELFSQKPESATWSRADLAGSISTLGRLIGFDDSAATADRELITDSGALRERAFRSLSWLLAALSECPVGAGMPSASAIVLVIEDLHWADPESLDLIEHLARNCQNLPLLVLGTARPSLLERRPGWDAGLPYGLRVQLGPLSAGESNALLEAVLRQAPEIPPALRSLVTEAAEGNPFYIEEIVKMLIDQKVIVPQAGPWGIRLAGLADARIPATLTGVLQARLDNLAPMERVVLQRASVIGRVFWDSAVFHLGNRESEAVPDWFFGGNLGQRDIAVALDGLQQKELVFSRGSSAFAGAVEFIFKHELLRTVAYESLLKKSRRRYHAQIAAWLVGQSGDRAADFAGLIATHFEQAAQYLEAAQWYGCAGQRARQAYAPAVGAEHFKKALRLVQKDGVAAPLPRQLEWQEGLGETLAALAHRNEALEAFTALRDLARRLNDPLAEARAWNGLAFVHERSGDNRDSIQCAEQAERLALPATAAGHAERIRAQYLKGWACYRLGDATAVLALADQTLKLCVACRDRRGIAASYKLLGVAQLQLGRYAEADGYFEQGRLLFQELDDQRNTAAMWSNRGETARARGDHETAVAYYEEALTIARQIGHRESELIYLANLASTRVELGQFVRAEADLREVIRQTPGPNSCILSEACASLSLACLGQGKYSEACEEAQRAIELARQSESALYLGTAWRALGQVGARHRQQHGQALVGLPGLLPPGSDPAHCFAESLRTFVAIKAQGEQARTLRAWGRYELASGAAQSGRRRLEEARAIFQTLSAAHEVRATDSGSGFFDLVRPQMGAEGHA